MNLVVLDASPAFDGLDLAPLRKHGELTVFEKTSPAQVAERISGATVVLTNKVKLGAAELAAAPNLKLVSVLATGYDVVDVSAAKAHGVTVCNVRGYSTASTAQHAVALLLELTNRVGAHSTDVARGGWIERNIWSYNLAPLTELDGKTLLVVGMGAIGSRVARIAEALGMTVLSGSARRPEELFALLPQADAVSLHCPLTPETRGLINAEFLAALKPGALLVNAARGPVIDDHAVAAALKSGTLAGYAADVTTTEPPLPENPLLTAPSCLLTPHNAWATDASRQRLLAETVENVDKFLAGTPRNVVGG